MSSRVCLRPKGSWVFANGVGLLAVRSSQVTHAPTLHADLDKGHPSTKFAVFNCPRAKDPVQLGYNGATSCTEHEHEGVEVAASMKAAPRRSSSRSGLISSHSRREQGGSPLAPSRTVELNICNVWASTQSFRGFIGFAITPN